MYIKKYSIAILMLLIFPLSSCHGEENQNVSNDIIYNSTTTPSDIEIYNKLNLTFYKALHLSEKDDNVYSISEKHLKIGDNKIMIPQISEMLNIDKQEEINSLIVENINKKVLTFISEPDKGKFFEFKYSTKFKNNSLLSFLFEVDYYMEGAAHPSLFSFSINIDLDNRTVLEKKDIIAMDKDMAKMLINGDFVPKNEISESFYPIYLDNVDKGNTLSVLEMSEICFSEKGIEFIIETNYATGGYMLLELPYTLLE